MSAPALRTLLAGAIDYAGLFPPASLPMREAVVNYAEYRAGDDAWALGRFVVPIARVAEFHEAARLLPSSAAPPWRLAALAGRGGAAEWRLVSDREQPGAIVDALELRAGVPAEVADAATLAPPGVDIFYEIPIDRDPGELIGAIARRGGKAKVRTGGVTADAFPRAADLARFIVACARARVAFKATAGLHHPLRGAHRLSYDAYSSSTEMFGFLNVLLAAALAAAGATEADVAELLVERDPRRIRLGSSGVEWRGHVVSGELLAQTRCALALSFGSCSFREPIDELEALGVL